MQIVGGARDRLGDHHQSSTVQQRTPDLPDRVVEGVGVALRPHPFGAEIQSEVHRFEQASHVVVGDGNALGDTRGAGGVDDVGDVIGMWRLPGR